MGKRKSSSKPVAKGRKEPLSTTFKCLFCNHEKAVSVSLDKANLFGKLRCKNCGQRFQAPINNLSAAVDVYADWVDACEDVRQKQPPKQRPQQNPNTLDHGFAGGARMIMKSQEQGDDLDAEGEDDDGDSLDGRPVKKAERRREPPLDDDDVDDVDDVEPVERAGKEKRQRVEVDDDDDED